MVREGQGLFAAILMVAAVAALEAFASDDTAQSPSASEREELPQTREGRHLVTSAPCMTPADLGIRLPAGARDRHAGTSSAIYANNQITEALRDAYEQSRDRLVILISVPPHDIVTILFYAGGCVVGADHLTMAALIKTVIARSSARTAGPVPQAPAPVTPPQGSWTERPQGFPKRNR